MSTLRAASKHLSEARMELVKATAPAVAGNVNKITPAFYKRMFGAHPELFSFFNRTNQREGRQPRALADSVVASVGNLSNLDAIKGPLEIIAHKHCALGVLPEHYPIVHDNFLAATAEVLGDAVTADVADAWSGVLMHLAEHLTAMEAKLYDDAAARPGGWDCRGKHKDFVVSRTVQESDTARSIYLKAADGSRAPAYTAGQFITVCNNPTDDKYFAPRHYTLSAPNNSEEELRITIKNHTGVEGVPAGLMSSHLHTVKEGDTVALRPPFGVFTRQSVGLADGSDAEVYVTGGIGITTAAAMMPEAVASGHKVAHIHSATGESNHALDKELAALKLAVSKAHYTSNKDINIAAYFDDLRAADIEPVAGASYMLCGPPDFMKTVYDQLTNAGVAGNKIHWENFGPRTHM